MEKAQFDKYNKIDPDADVRVVFDKTNHNWTTNQDYNHYFMRMTMSYMHDKLLREGHLFVNDFLIALGSMPTPEGQLLGWYNFGDKKLDYSFTSDNESGTIVLKNAQFIWHTL